MDIITKMKSLSILSDYQLTVKPYAVISLKGILTDVDYKRESIEIANLICLSTIPYIHPLPLGSFRGICLFRCRINYSLKNN